MKKPAIEVPPSKTVDYCSRYANHASFEETLYDLRMTFGDLQQRETDPAIEVSISQHTSVRLSWPVAKCFAMLCAANVAGHERTAGVIKIPRSIVPDLVTEGEEASTSIAQALQDLDSKLAFLDARITPAGSGLTN